MVYRPLVRADQIAQYLQNYPKRVVFWYDDIHTQRVQRFVLRYGKSQLWDYRRHRPVGVWTHGETWVAFHGLIDPEACWTVFEEWIQQKKG